MVVTTMLRTVDGQVSRDFRFNSDDVIEPTFGSISTAIYIYIYIYIYISLSTVVLNSRDRQGKVWLPKKRARKKQPYNNNYAKN